MHYILNCGNGKARYDKEMIQIYNQNYTQINIQWCSSKVCFEY